MILISGFVLCGQKVKENQLGFVFLGVFGLFVLFIVIEKNG